jgi:hypothetical protein
MSMKRLAVVAALVPALVAAQVAPAEFSPPPLVPATPPPMPPPEPGTPAAAPGTPPPPSLTPQAPPSAGTPYSPYGTPRQQEKPGPEVGLMVSESLFGALTAAGVTVLPYFLLFGNGALTGDPTLSSIIFVLIFSAAPLAVAQTQVSLANGSRHYFSETWPAALTGLVGQAAVLGIFYATGWLPTGQVSGGVPNGGSVPWLLIGSIGLVPILQMVAINLFKQPKYRPLAANAKPGEGVSLGLPMPTPVVAQTSGGLSVGASLSFLNGTF